MRPTSCDIIIMNARDSSNLHIVDSECNPTIIRVLKFRHFQIFTLLKKKSRELDRYFNNSLFLRIRLCNNTNYVIS